MRRLLMTGLLLVGVLFDDTGRRVEASRPTPQWVIDAVNVSAARWGANPTRMIEVIRCETGGDFDPYSANRNGLDHGIAQFRVWPGGYSIISEAPAARGMNPWDAAYTPEVAIDAMAWHWGTKPGTTGAEPWLCWSVLYGSGY